MVRTDIVAYFEQIQHGELEERLTALGVADSTAREVRGFLRAVISTRGRGLPQGFDASSVLSTIYLDPADKALLRRGIAYYRYVDDIYIFAGTEAEARLALRLAEAELRRLGLLLQSAKTTITVGHSAVEAALAEDEDEIQGVDYVVRHTRTLARKAVQRAWRSASRRKPWSPRYIKYLLGKLKTNRDPIGVTWCLNRLGIIDWLADVVGSYLALFADTARVQRGISRHLRSDMCMSPFEEVALLRAMLSATRAPRTLLDHCREVVANRNADIESRSWAAVLLGRHGDASDHELVARECVPDEVLARAALVALQRANANLRGTAYRDAAAHSPDLAVLANKLRGRPSPEWPSYPEPWRARRRRRASP
jgi:hypothetical protein